MNIRAYLSRFGPSYRDTLILFGLALLVRLLAAWPQQQPNYMDAAYYYVNGLNLALGRGFVEDFVWNYLGNPGPPPQPSHLYWMPLTSILAWLGMAIGGANYRAAQFPFVALSALLVPLSYGIAYTLSSRRSLAWLAGLFSLFSGFYFPFWTAIDNFTPFAVAGALALVCAWKGGDGTDGTKGTKGTEGRRKQKSGIREQGVWFVLGGVFAGLAHLARADGPLLLAVIILVYMLRSSEFGVRSSGFRDYILRTTHYGLRFTLPLLLGYLLIMTPWFIRNWQVAGALLPASGSQTIWLVDYDDLFSYRQEISPQRFWAQGMGPILQGRWWVFTVNLQTVLAVWGMIFLAPLAVIGGWHRRDHSLVQLSGGYALLLFLAMTLLFAFPGARGGLFHSGAALLPFICALAGVGLDRGVDWVAARRRGWQPKTAKRVFGVGLLVMAMGLSSFIYYQRVIRNNAWNRADALYPAIASWVDEQKPDAVVMIGNPPAYRYHGGGLSVIVPDGDMATILEVARHYGVDYLILDPNHPEPLNPLYQNPSLNPALHLVQTYGAGSGGEVYIFEIKD